MSFPSSHLSVLATRFRRDERGGVALLFGATMTAVMLASGVALDYSTASAARQDLQRALDAASLMAARTVSDGETDAAKIRTAARSAFDANFVSRIADKVTDANFTVAADTKTSTVKVAATSKVKTAFMKIAGIDSVDIGSSSVSTIEDDKIEVVLMVDMTGSMASSPKAGGQPKITSLKQSVSSFIDTLLPSSGKNKARVRIAIVPFSEGVNGGAYASTVTGGKSTKCVLERQGAEALTDAPPSVAPLGAPGKWSVSCPSNAVRPLTNDRTALIGDIAGFAATGTTAGHIGTEWSRYVLSSKWSSVWPVASAPAAAGTKGVRKIAILMTDGMYNTSYDASGKPTVTTDPNPNTTSVNAAIATCKAMQQEGTTVYTIGFDITGSGSTTVKKNLQDCASTVSGTKAFYDAADSKALQAAYDDIASRLLSLRLSS